MCSAEKQQVVAWSCEQDGILIDFVKMHESLYNIHSKDYRKTQIKQRLWNEIGGILQKTGIDCSKRWSYVRDYYIRRKRNPGTGSAGEAAKKRSEQLSFLDSCSSGKRSTIGNIEDNETEEDSMDDVYNKEYPSETMPVTSDGESQFSNEYIFDGIQVQNVDTRHTLFLKREYPTLEAENSGKRIKLQEKFVEKRHQPVNVPEQDENDLFFGSMAKIVKKLPAQIQAKLRLEIGNMVGHAEIDFLLGSPLTNNPTPSASSLVSHDAASPPSPSAT